MMLKPYLSELYTDMLNMHNNMHQMYHLYNNMLRLRTSSDDIKKHSTMIDNDNQEILEPKSGNESVELFDDVLGLDTESRESIDYNSDTEAGSAENINNGIIDNQKQLEELQGKAWKLFVVHKSCELVPGFIFIDYQSRFKKLKAAKEKIDELFGRMSAKEQISTPDIREKES